MSWGLRYEYADGDITEDTYGVVEEFTAKADRGEIVTEVIEQAFVAISAVDKIIESGFVGEATGKFGVSINGHANPEHKPTPGWADDALNISIYQVKETK